MIELNKIYCEDCLETMKRMEDKSIDLIVTDPPYDVDYANWDKPVNGWLDEARRIAEVVLFTPGIANVWQYPQTSWIIGWAKPGSTRRNGTGGFNHWEPVLMYGNRKVMVDYIYLPDCVNHSESNVGHPCPKPLNLYKWLVDKIGNGGVVYDPFLGSGTTAIACEKLGRKWIGSEINPDYVKIAERRLRDFRAQGNLFT